MNNDVPTGQRGQPALPGFSNGSSFDRIRKVSPRGDEYWSARDLMSLFGFSRWEDVQAGVARARAVIENAQGKSVGQANIEEHLRQVKDGYEYRNIQDFYLSRYASYTWAMNCDPRKPQIAEAQSYFAVKTGAAATRTALEGDALILAAVQELTSRLKAEQARAKALQPLAESWEALASANGDLSVRDAAQILCRDYGIDTGQHRLFRYLRECSRPWVGSGNRPYQWAVDAGLVNERLRSFKITRTNGDMQLAPPQLRITVKGLQRLHQEFAAGKGALLGIGG